MQVKGGEENGRGGKGGSEDITKTIERWMEVERDRGRKC